MIKGGCSQCGAELTPMRPHSTLHFEKLLQKKNAMNKGTNSRKRVKPQYYGEALTSDEIFHTLEDEKAGHKQPPAKKRKQALTPMKEVPGKDDHDTEDDSIATESIQVESHDEGVSQYLCDQ